MTDLNELAKEVEAAKRKADAAYEAKEQADKAAEDALDARYEAIEKLYAATQSAIDGDPESPAPSVEAMVEAISDNGEHRASLDAIVDRANASDDLSGSYVSHQRAFNRPVFDPLHPTANGSDTEEQA